MWGNFKTYGDSREQAFETLVNQIFERYLYREYSKKIVKFKVINGSGGDGGIEAYGELDTGKIIAVQSKYFISSMQASQISQIKKSITTALDLRPDIIEYIISVPRNIGSITKTKGGKVSKKTETKRVEDLESQIKSSFPKLKITWWMSDKILNELQEPDNDGIHKYWFEKEIITFSLLQQQLKLQKTNSWLKERYVPDLHARGVIQKEINKLLFSKEYSQELAFEVHKIQKKAAEIQKLLRILADTDDSIKFLKKAQNFTKKLNDNASLLMKEVLSSNRNYVFKFKNSTVLFDLVTHLQKVNPTNIEKNIVYELRKTLSDFINEQPIDFLKEISVNSKLSRKLIFGGPGTGKTQGLVNAVEYCLAINYPAILIRAKTADNSSWTSLLNDSLDLKGWTKNEIFSALDILAIKNDILKASAMEVGKEPNYPITNVLICIDGLDEDIGKEESWYDRIAETKEIALRYPRVKFVFTARHYFYDNTKEFDLKTEEVRLTGDGDVQINEVIDSYFKRYKISGKLSNPLKGLTSLLALRLFCEEYEGKKLNEIGKVETKVQKLLNLKVTRLNKEFLEQIFPIKSVSENPLIEGLLIISKMFFQKGDITREELLTALGKNSNMNFTVEISTSLLEFLSSNGILTSYERIDKTGILDIIVVHYSITYQSIIEIIISEEIYESIKTGDISEIPEQLLRPIASPIFSRHTNTNIKKITPNVLIIQNLVSRVFNEQERLIGENGFLKGKFNREQILNLQFYAIKKAPLVLAKKYENYIKNLFFQNYTSRFKVLKQLVIPTAKGRDGYFDANWLHEILYNQASTFDRDKLWSDMDKEEINRLSEAETYLYNEGGRLRNLLMVNKFDKIFISQYAKHDEFPLILAWGLSTIDRELRENITTALTKWGIINPKEYLKLLNKLFFCNDPQIQEDLSSIALGIASKINDKEGLLKMAKWSLNKIFGNLLKHRNVVVRQGFRAVTERAFQFRLISEEEVKVARPKPIKTFRWLKLDKGFLDKNKEQFYPIVHDLAWYVIENAYENFLMSDDDSNKRKKIRPDRKFLNRYSKKYGEKEIYPRTWAMSAAIEYIKSLGLTRQKSNYYTDASHGSKSKVYTYEEKYTWLAVNYLQGYLADYLPYTESSYDTITHWVKDYGKLSYVRNPSEDILDEVKMNYMLDKPNDRWRIKESLVEELVITETIQADLQRIVTNDPSLNFGKWLYFKNFTFIDNEEKAICLYGRTSLHNKSETLITSLTIQACIIEKKDFNILKNKFLKPEDNTYWLSGLDSFQANTDTKFYSNPTDIVWMNWIEETNNKIDIGDDISFLFTRTSVTKKSTKGEKEVYIPSKKIRSLLGITDFKNDTFINISGKVVGAISDISEGPFKDRQDLLVVNSSLLKEKLKAEGLQFFWFAQVFSRKNPHNDELKTYSAQRVKKYFLWEESESIKEYKFWDKRTSNN